MKELDAFMKALEERNVIKPLKITVALCPLPDKIPDEKKEECIKDAIRACLTEFFMDDKNEDVQNLFFDFANELAYDRLIKELNINPNGNQAETKKLAKEFLNGLIKKYLD